MFICSLKICEPVKLPQHCIGKKQEDEKHEAEENQEAEDVPEEKMQQQEETMGAEKQEEMPED